MKAISILGSTGSIGCNTLKVIRHLKDFRVAALAAGNSIAMLAEQVRDYHPELVSCATDNGAETLLRLLHADGITPPRIEFGESGLLSVATHDAADTVVSATVGAVGFVPTLRAIETGKRVALANKETLVMAGELMMKAAESSGAEILPVDSEHNAIHQCLRGEARKEVSRLILTASGGPFRTWPADRLDSATVAEALDHPKWSMGDKITIDSATLMNKGFEVLEAHWLFGFAADRIDVIVHPQSIVHSMVEMVDGSVIAQLGVTDMRHAIQYALTFPVRKKNCMQPLDFRRLNELTFEQPDFDRFPCLEMAYAALKKGGTAPAALNAANEVSVRAFLDGKITFPQIASINGRVMREHIAQAASSLEAVIDADRVARASAEHLVLSIPVSATAAQPV